MKKLFSRQDAIHADKAFYQSVFSALLSIILCITGLTSMTWAWFGQDIASDVNSIQLGSFDVSIEVIGLDVTDTEPIALSDVSGSGSKRCLLPRAGEYRITLTVLNSSSVKGFCYVETDGIKVATETIFNPTADYPDASNPFVFTLVTAHDNTDIILTPCWGIHTNPLIVHQGSLLLSECYDGQ